MTLPLQKPFCSGCGTGDASACGVALIAFGALGSYGWPCKINHCASQMTAQSRFPDPSPADAEVARTSGERLAALLNGDRTLMLTVTGTDGQEAVELPTLVGPLLMEILRDIAAGSAVAVLRKDAEMTTQQAADLLGVSRPYLIRLLQDGGVPYRKVGTHRRVRLNDLLRYRNETDAARRRALDELAADAQDLGMGY